MTALLIQGNNAKNLRLLRELAEQLGEQVVQLNKETSEDLGLAALMDKVKTGKQASREAVFAALAK